MDEVLDVFEPFLKKYYDGKYRKQGRSWGIEMSHVDLDLVPTSSVSLAEFGLLQNKMLESEDDIISLYETKQYNIKGYNWNCEFDSFFSKSNDWKDEPLFIPDREAEKWDKTHPLEQIRWTQEKNKNCNGHYVNVVKCIKWWRKEKYPDVKHPKSYPLEHFIGDCCPDDITSVAEGITLTLEKMVSDYSAKPYLADRGVPEHDVFARLTEEDYSEFYDAVCDAAQIARSAYDASSVQESADLWRQLFGNKFPEPPKKDAIFTERKSNTSSIPGGRFA